MPVQDSTLASSHTDSLIAQNHALAVPARSELEHLYALARFGSMRRIEEYAAHLATLDVAYVPFAERLRELAQQVEEDQLLALLERYLAVSRHDSHEPNGH
jgi:hypothetical protein